MTPIEGMQGVIGDFTTAELRRGLTTPDARVEIERTWEGYTVRVFLPNTASHVTPGGSYGVGSAPELEKAIETARTAAEARQALPARSPR